MSLLERVFEKVTGKIIEEETSKFHGETEYKKPIGMATIVEDKPDADYFPNEIEHDQTR